MIYYDMLYDTHLIGIDDDDVITHVPVGPKGRLVFAFENGSNLTGQSAHGLITGINQVPSTLQSLSRKRHVVY